MEIVYYLELYIFMLLQITTLGYGDRTKDKMYEKIHNADSCFRRLNATHQIGCSSKRGGSTGVVHYSETIEELNYILENGTAPPYIPVIPTRLFTAETLRNLIDSKKVSGLILHPNNEKLDHFSHENQCPNSLSNFPDTCQKSVWNPYGTGLLYTEIPFPIFYVKNEEDVGKMKDCFRKFNNFSYEDQAERSLCALELKSFMHATTDTPTCRRRSNIITNLNPMKFCDPLGDSNVWAALYPLVSGSQRNDTKPRRDHKYIVIAARTDTTSMFEATAGANSPVTGVVTLLSSAKLLKDILKDDDIEKAKKNVLFIVFNGETYDYIGSQRMLYDMKKGNFPVEGLKEDNNIMPLIKPENISLFIEISQLGNSANNAVFLHHLNVTTEITNFFDKLSTNSGPVTIYDVPGSLPPASLHTFLKDNTSFPGIILSDHEKSYRNNFYNSLYDNSSNIGYVYYNATDNLNVTIPKDSIQQFIASISEMVAKSVYQEIKGEVYKGDSIADVVLIDELFHCYLEEINCKVHAATQRTKYPKGPGSLYVGVEHATGFATTVTYSSLGWFVGEVVGEGNINCTNTPPNYAFNYYNMSKSIRELNVTLCFKMAMNMTDAISPAFSIPGYDWSSGLYSTWTESTWSEIGVRIFLKPSAAHESMTIALGSMSMILSFLMVYFVKSRAHVLFTPPLPTDPPTDC